MNRFEQAFERLNQRLKDRVGKQIIYHAGNNSINITTVIGRTAFRIRDWNVSRLLWSDRDYFVNVDDLVINGVKIQPARGHWFEEITPQSTETFEVSAPDGEQTWRYSDPEQTVYRIHTKKKTYI
jgi:hypothetical protein